MALGRALVTRRAGIVGVKVHQPVERGLGQHARCKSPSSLIWIAESNCCKLSLVIGFDPRFELRVATQPLPGSSDDRPRALGARRLLRSARPGRSVRNLHHPNGRNLSR